MPDFADLHRQPQRHSRVTQQLLWEEYRQANPDGHQYSRFCELYERWRRKQDVVLRQEQKAGDTSSSVSLMVRLPLLVANLGHEAAFNVID